jgi:hypothetical protein
VSDCEKRSCLERLDGFIREINDLMSLIGERRVLLGEDREQAADMLTRLKSRLEGEYRRTSTKKGHESLNEVEQAYYAPAVHKASACLRIRVSSVPGARWIEDLYSAWIDLTFMASQLREQLGDR